jgi:methylmalonyl-CoA/ethylmalonyl-CoA epimerase
MKFHHIGIACKDIESVKNSLAQLFPLAILGDVTYDRVQDAKLCMIELEDGTKLELIQGKPVESLLKKNYTYYHLCFSVANLDETIRDFNSKGVLSVADPAPACLFGGSRIAFLYTPMGLVELLEDPE